MIRIVIFFIIVAAIAAVAVWIANEPGEVIIVWGDWQLATSPAALVAAVAIIGVAAAILWQVARWFWTGPGAISQWRAVRRQRRGYRALTHGLVAAAAGDPKGSRRLARRADLLLGEPPLTLLLSAQAAQLEGDADLAKGYFEAMLEHSETEFLGVRGLLVQANKSGDHTAALSLAERAFSLRPDTPWVLSTLLEFQTRDGRWSEAVETLKNAIRHKVIDADAGARREAALLVEQSRDLRKRGEVREALKLSNQARSADPSFLPAQLAAAELSFAAGRPQVAERIIGEAWERAPHPALARLFLALHAGERALDRIQRVEKLIAVNPDNPESHILLAEGALDAQLWGKARTHLSEAIKLRPSAGVFRLMAQLEEREHGDLDAAHRWLVEASESAPDPAWICGSCGVPGSEWSISCGSCGALDSLEWRQLAMLEAPGDGEALEADAGATAQPATVKLALRGGAEQRASS